MRNPTDFSRVVAPLLAMSAGVSWAAPAYAQWETAHGAAIESGRDCPAPHDKSPQLRRSDGGTFDIPAGYKGEIEIYGHGIDLIGSAAVDGRDWAERARGVGGGENAARGCGSIGSIVVHFDVPNTTLAGTHTLRFGDQTMRIRIVKPSILRTAWSPQTLEGGSTLPAGAPPPAAAPASSPPLLLTARQNSNGCGPNGVGCSGSSSAVAGGGGNRFGPPDAAPRLDDGIGGCIDELGGSALIEGTTLTLTFPNARTAQFDVPCLTRPIYFNVETGAPSDHVGGFRAGATNQFRQDPGRAVDPPRYSGTLSGFTGPAPLAEPNRDFQSLRMSADLARTFVGERRILLNPAGSGSASQLTLVLRTDPANGIRDVQGVPFTGNRLSSSFEIRFDFLAAASGRETAFWRLRATGSVSPATCFTATSGSAASIGAGAGKFTLTAREAAGCDNARFALDLAPGFNGAGFFDRAPYSKTVEFALPPRSAPELNPVLPRRQ